MTNLDIPTKLLARIYYVVWVASVVLLVGAGVIYGLARFAEIDIATGIDLPQIFVQGYLLLVPLAILVFSVLMAVKKHWMFAITGFALSLIWVGAKLLG